MELTYKNKTFCLEGIPMRTLYAVYKELKKNGSLDTESQYFLKFVEGELVQFSLAEENEKLPF